MKHYLKLCIALLFVTSIQAQSVNKEINKNGQTPFLLGEITKDGLTSGDYNTWFSKVYENTQLDKKSIKNMTPIIDDYEITVFMGTWCIDSKREVPRFYKILEACNFPKNQLTVVALSKAPNMYLQSSEHEERGLNIHSVPTFIFYKDGKEVNRIIESPIESLEEDMLNIFTTNTYKSNYQIITYYRYYY